MLDIAIVILVLNIKCYYCDLLEYCILVFNSTGESVRHVVFGNKCFRNKNSTCSAMCHTYFPYLLKNLLRKIIEHSLKIQLINTQLCSIISKYLLNCNRIYTKSAVVVIVLILSTQYFICSFVVFFCLIFKTYK